MVPFMLDCGISDRHGTSSPSFQGLVEGPRDKAVHCCLCCGVFLQIGQGTNPCFPSKKALILNESSYLSVRKCHIQVGGIKKMESIIMCPSLVASVHITDGVDQRD